MLRLPWKQAASPPHRCVSVSQFSQALSVCVTGESISPQVLGTAVAMVTQDGTTSAGHPHVTMVTDGNELQPVGIMGRLVSRGCKSSGHSR